MKGLFSKLRVNKRRLLVIRKIEIILCFANNIILIIELRTAFCEDFAMFKLLLASGSATQQVPWDCVVVVIYGSRMKA